MRMLRNRVRWNHSNKATSSRCYEVFATHNGPGWAGDIERILVLGAHGPRKLTMLCLDEGV